jgi:hypothetical protein
MTASFVSLAVAYSLGIGQLCRKGVRQRPWLEMRRLETEATYLEHQVRALRRSIRQPIRVEEDDISGRGYYDLRRVRIQSPYLERAVEILEGGINEEALQVAGAQGIACLWLDRGRWICRSGEIWLDSSDEAALVNHAIQQLGVASSLLPGTRPIIRFGPQQMHDLASCLRPLVHRSMRHTLRLGSSHGRALIQSTDK